MRALTLASAVCVLGLSLAATNANAVVIVIGGGPAQDCYATAEFGDQYKAFDSCTRALAIGTLSPRDRAATYVNRSVVRLRAKDFAGAMSDCDESIARYPRFGEAYVNLGAALINMEQPDRALRELNKAIDLGLDKVHLAYYNRGLAKEKLNDIRGAYLDYKKSLELDPRFTMAADQLTRFVVTGMMERMKL